MNFIAYDAAYSLFPQPTFEKRETLVIGKNTSETNPTIASALAKYRERGWRIRYILQSTDESAVYHPNTRSAQHDLYGIDVYRRVGDASCWVLRLDTTNVRCRTILSTTSMHFEWDPVEENTFRLAYKRYAVMKFHIFTSSITRYAYAIAHGEHGAMFDDFFLEHGYLEETYEEERRQRNKPVVKTWYEANHYE
jgi:hypothetical protein